MQNAVGQEVGLEDKATTQVSEWNPRLKIHLGRRDSGGDEETSAGDQIAEDETSLEEDGSSLAENVTSLGKDESSPKEDVTSEDEVSLREEGPSLSENVTSLREEGLPVGGSVSSQVGTLPRFRFDVINLALVAILLLSLVLRMLGTDWDQGGLYHPDERDFLGRAERLDFSQLTESGLFSVESRLNPRWFNYGSLPLYALAGLKSLASPFSDKDWNLFDLRFPGRNLSAIADTITVFLVYLLATRLVGDRRAGLIAALLSAMAVIHIQNAHYTAVDAPMTMFIVASVYFSTRLVQTRKQSDAVIAGLMLGFAIATKVTAAPLALSVAVALLFLLIRPGSLSGGLRSPGPQEIRLFINYGAMAVAATVIALLLTQPYMIIDWGTYFNNIFQQSEMVRRVADLPFTRQYIDTPAYLYQFRQLSTWGLGISLGIVVWLGLIWAIVRTLIKRELEFIVVLSFLVPYLVLNGQFEVKFLRYMLPATPLLIVFAGCAIWYAYVAVLPRFHSIVRVGAYAIGAVGFLLLAHYTFAYLNVFRGPHPAQEVSKWLRENAGPGTVVIQEHWEEGIPNIPDFNMHEKLPMYEDDNSSKFDMVAQLMEGADYLVFYSNRLAATIPRLPERYPLSSTFYDLLFNDGLGYKVVYSSVRVPELFGVVYWDDPYARVPFDVPDGYQKPRGSIYNWDWFGWADESFTVYEHPHAIVFQNVERLDKGEFLDRIYMGRSPDDLNRAIIGDVGLVYDEEQAREQITGDDWNAIYFLKGLRNEYAWLIWLVAVQLISLAALPLTYVVFRPLTDRGYLFSKPLGILIVATLAWLLASFGILGFSALSVGISILLLGMVSLIIFWRLGEEIVFFVKAHLKTIAIGELIFVGAFLLFFVIRLANPDLWHAWRGGEKPMDFAYLNAITRSTIMPPYDPWFAGGYLNYYYYGQFIIASLIRVTGVIPSVAYNLAVPLIFALTAASVYTIAYNLIAMSLRARGAIRLGYIPVVFGAIAALLAVVAGNIDGLVQVASGLYASYFESRTFPDFDYWRSTRLFDHATGGNEITEFPFFTFLFADLHAHMIAIPFAVLALGLGISTFLRAGMERLSRFETATALIVAGIVVGSLRLINSWDYPTQLLLVAGFIFAGEFLYGHKGKLIGITHAVFKTAIVGIIGYVVFIPFHSNFELFNSGVESSRFQTALWRYVFIHTIFIFALGSWLIIEWRRGSFRFDSIISKITLEYGDPKWVFGAIIGLFGLGGVVIVLAYPHYITVFVTLTAAAILGVTGLMAYLRRHPGQRYIIITVALTMMALFLAAGIDVVTVKNDIGRQNTIFKFYIQAWWLLAIAATYAIWRLWDVGAFLTKQMSGIKALWISAFAILAVGVFIYPVMATEVRLDDRFNITGGPGIDGEAYMADAVYNTKGIAIELATDRSGIEWLRENVKGSPVVVEAQWDLYTWANRISIYTGLPTVIGWDWHQTQQRHDYRWEVQRRRNAVNDFYTTSDVDKAKQFLDEFNVRYVYVGELERGAYPASGIEKFDNSSVLNLHPVFHEGPVTIYEYKG